MAARLPRFRACLLAAAIAVLSGPTAAQTAAPTLEACTSWDGRVPDSLREATRPLAAPGRFGGQVGCEVSGVGTVAWIETLDLPGGGRVKVRYDEASLTFAMVDDEGGRWESAGGCIDWKGSLVCTISLLMRNGIQVKRSTGPDAAVQSVRVEVHLQGLMGATKENKADILADPSRWTLGMSLGSGRQVDITRMSGAEAVLAGGPEERWVTDLFGAPGPLDLEFTYLDRTQETVRLHVPADRLQALLAVLLTAEAVVHESR